MRDSFRALMLTAGSLLSGCGPEPARSVSSPAEGQPATAAPAQDTAPSYKKHPIVVYDGYLDVRGEKARPFYQALDFTTLLQREMLAEVRFKNEPSQVQIDVHGDNHQFKVFTVVKGGGISVASCNGRAIETTTLTPDNKLTVTVEAWSPETGIGKLLSETEITDSLKARQAQERLTKMAVDIDKALQETRNAERAKLGTQRRR